MLNIDILDSFMNSKIPSGSPQIILELRKEYQSIQSQGRQNDEKAKLRSILKKKFKLLLLPAISFLYRRMYLIGILN